MEEINDEVYDEIRALSAQGDECCENENFMRAVLLFQQALNLVPNPKTDWDASTWLYTAIGDAYYLWGKHKKAANAFYDAMNCPDGITNPFICLRLGQSLFDLDDQKEAEQFLMKAYMLGGMEIFDGEFPRYLDYMEEKFDL